MPRVYKRKTSRGCTPTDVFERATKEVREENSIQAAALDANVDRMTLMRYTGTLFLITPVSVARTNCK